MTNPEPLPAARDPLASFARLRRLALKELREILRDRRTILTLVLMPLLLYPLLSIAFQQLFLAGVVGEKGPEEFHLGFANEAELRFVNDLLIYGKEAIERRDKNAGRPPRELPKLLLFEAKDFDQAVRNREVNLGLRLPHPEQIRGRAGDNLAVDLEVFYLENSPSAQAALRQVTDRLAAANTRALVDRFRSLNRPQRDEPFLLFTRVIPDPEAKSGLSMAALVPLILILMTITGAVYPAIDLTAGERERGTLEVLVAAPLPRFGLLFAKYVAVMTVALLTALVNLVMMTATVLVTGLGTALFGDAGLSPGVLFTVFGLLLLFAAFFSAVLLALTSFARSFKEAQAYLIPLMLLALAPGMIGLMPGLKLAGPLAVAPLINIVLLARDLFEGTASFALSIVVIGSTLLYAAAALALAARVFGAEGVLYSAHSGWSELFRRPSERGTRPTLGSVLTCLAVLFPAYFFLGSVVAQLDGLTLVGKLVLNAVASIALFSGLPMLAIWWQRLEPRAAFRLSRPPLLTLLGGLLLGLGLWPFAHELVLLLQRLGLTTLRPEVIEKAKGLLAGMQELSPALLLLLFAIVPAVTEEGFFRGFLFRGLESSTRPLWTFLLTGVLFGAFHLILAQAVAVERFASSTCMGMVLGWVAWRSGSIWPTILLHCVHNGTLVLLARYQPELAAMDWTASEQQHLPMGLLGGAGACVAIGVALVYWKGTASVEA